MRRSLVWVVALALTVGVGSVALDAARRAATLATFTRGIGTPDNPSREEVKAPEWNVVYLLGLAVGTGAGAAMAAAAGLWWQLARSRRPGAAPGLRGV